MGYVKKLNTCENENHKMQVDWKQYERSVNLTNDLNYVLFYDSVKCCPVELSVEKEWTKRNEEKEYRRTISKNNGDSRLYNVILPTHYALLNMPERKLTWSLSFGYWSRITL